MYWKFGIAIEQTGLTGPEATNYESVVKMHLDWIEATDVGKALFHAIGRNILDAAPANLATFRGTTDMGTAPRGVLIQPYTGGACNAAELRSLVNYSPYIFNGTGPCGHYVQSIVTNRGMLPSEVLFHELVHALRDAAGHGNRTAPLGGGLSGYGDTEEFIAVVVTNIFMTDPTNKYGTGIQVGLRRDHGFGKMTPNLADSLGFFSSSRNTFNRIDRFCKDDPWFTKKLAGTRAAFNPIAAYYNNTNDVRNRSSSALAA
jgi:hypothetical protein